MLNGKDNRDKLSLQLKLTLNAAQELDAKQIMQELEALVGAAGCGGRRNLAQTRGKNVENTRERTLEIIKTQLLKSNPGHGIVYNNETFKTSETGLVWAVNPIDCVERLTILLNECEISKLKDRL